MDDSEVIFSEGCLLSDCFERDPSKVIHGDTSSPFGEFRVMRCEADGYLTSENPTKKLLSEDAYFCSAWHGSNDAPVLLTV